MEIVLSVVAGPHLGRSFSFEGHDTFLVGRSKQTHFELADKDKYFSRMHFLVEVNPPCVRLTDLNSHNGTYVNDQRVDSVDLHDGDLIKAGHTILQVAVRPAPGEEVVPKPRGEPTVEVTASRENFPEIPGYRLLSVLGEGGMGVVYRALDLKGGNTVAIKAITPEVMPSPIHIERFLREAAILRDLKHDNIVGFRELGQVDGCLYFVMEFVDGIDAGRLLEQHGPLPVPTAVRMICQLLKALAYAHERGFVHRDIKPANLLIETRSTGRRIKLADFGLARVYQSSQMSGITVSGHVGGTIKFMPPEQITHYREVRPATDQYSAAASLYNLLTGAFVYDFTDSHLQPLYKILHEAPVPIRQRRGDLPAGLERVIHKALARAPEKRFADVMPFRKALLPFAR